MILAVGDAQKLAFEDNFFRLVFGSPPYQLARTYGAANIARGTSDWVEFMEACTLEALRVSAGAVLWVVSGIGSMHYEPCPELLIAAMYNKCCILRPNIWTKNGVPTGKYWFSNDWEYVLAFAKEVPLEVWQPETIGTPLKYRKGGNFRQRKRNGERSEGGEYPTHAVRMRPSNVHHVTVGGGHMGWEEATSVNEAPFPENLANRFIQVLSRPGERILDPFSGSGTTPCVAEMLGRVGYGIDLREDQIVKSRARQDYIDSYLQFHAEAQG